MTTPFRTWVSRRAAGGSRLMVLLLLAAPMLAGCHLMSLFTGSQPERVDKDAVAAGMPGKHHFRVSQFQFLSDFEIRKDLPIFNDLGVLREHVYRELRLPPTNTEIFVYLFETKERYEEFLHKKYPQLPDRRAYFIAQARRLGGAEDLNVYTYWNNNIQQDLRHELTHALLHSTLKDVPIWLDEGLAEYFEVPAAWNGVNPDHVEKLRKAGVRFDLARLEQLKDVSQMKPPEYRESWAWVHLMLRSSPKAKQTLVGYLHELRTNPNPGPLRPRLAPAFLALENDLHTHLVDVERKLTRPTTALR